MMEGRGLRIAASTICHRLGPQDGFARADERPMKHDLTGRWGAAGEASVPCRDRQLGRALSRRLDCEGITSHHDLYVSF